MGVIVQSRRVSQPQEPGCSQSSNQSAFSGTLQPATSLVSSAEPQRPGMHFELLANSPGGGWSISVTLSLRVWRSNESPPTIARCTRGAYNSWVVPGVCTPAPGNKLEPEARVQRSPMAVEPAAPRKAARPDDRSLALLLRCASPTSLGKEAVRRGESLPH
ncbi:uncharacterized protein N7482_002533 [Penicillium canariense]|uniref:Uncharacterized protein n=1 Tax=Penicillium canariense TaxID=189055 RepID=A0A9W9IJ67_9EURO|nr:uncharacterized protein N7482_002533 [Penicillium canariense]KAJ5176656.1 hypothetical protein N7482_002533 [Penicillium canariense]